MAGLKISNYVSYFLSMVEVLCYAGVPYGFGFIQYIFEREGVFWKELCYDEDLHGALCEMQESGLECPSSLTSTPCLRRVSAILKYRQLKQHKFIILI
jgi:hypothetical protein